VATTQHWMVLKKLKAWTSSFTCMFKSLSSTVEKQLKALNCEKKLGCVFVLTRWTIAVRSRKHKRKDCICFVSDRNNAGFRTKTTCQCVSVCRKVGRTILKWQVLTRSRTYKSRHKTN
jgi:hypothetical protein